MAMNAQELKVISDFLNTDLIPLFEAECERLPAPYNGVVKSVVGAMLPMAVNFVSGKLNALAQPAAAPAPVVTAPVQVVAP